MVPFSYKLSWGQSEIGLWVGCRGTIQTELGPIHKQFVVYQNIPQIDVELTFDWKSIPCSSFKTGITTLLPEAYDISNLFYATHNGGSEWETFYMRGKQIAHDNPASRVVTASYGLGATEGLIVLGDSNKGIAVQYDQTICAAMPMITFGESFPSFFGRLMFSCGEIDESRRDFTQNSLKFSYQIAGLSVADYSR